MKTGKRKQEKSPDPFGQKPNNSQNTVEPSPSYVVGGKFTPFLLTYLVNKYGVVGRRLLSDHLALR